MEYTIIDSHCHPQLSQYDEDRDEVLARAQQAGVGIVCVGTNIQTSKAAAALAEQYEGIYSSVGSHPIDEQKQNFDLNAYRELAQHPKVVAVGEIGLDYFHSSDREEQKIRFQQQFELAQEVGKPIIIHCRDAHDDMLEIISQYPGVIHSFNSSIEYAKRYLDLGYFLGLNAIVTFSKTYHDMVRYIPLDRILLETDAPYLAPAPHRGKRNEPIYLSQICESIATIKGLPSIAMQTQTSKNASQLFGM